MNARSSVGRDSVAIRDASVVSTTRFITKNGTPCSSTPSSCTGTIAG